MGQAKPTPLGVLWCAGLVLVGLGMIGFGWSSLPPARALLSVVEQRGQPRVSTELITEQSRHGNTSYRTQRIALNVPGFGARIVSPARTLWVDDIDRVRSDQVISFLVDPVTDILFEATTEGRTLLAYDTTAGARSGRGWAMIAIGFVMLAAGAIQLAPIFRQR